MNQAIDGKRRIIKEWAWYAGLLRRLNEHAHFCMKYDVG